MSQDIKMPEVSEGVTEGKVVTISVSKGDRVEQDQTLMEIETDKAVVALPSPFTSKITEITVSDGDTVEVGQTVMKGDPEDGGGAAEPAAAEEKPQQAEKAASEESEEPAPATAADATETEKADEPAAAEADEETRKKPAEREESSARRRESSLPPPRTGVTAPEDVAPASPLVRRVARELGVDVHVVPGSGPGGRITEDDVRAFVRQAMQNLGRGAGAVGAAPDARPLPDFAKWGEIERQDLSQVRRLTAEAMSYAWRTAPQVTQYDEADVTAVEDFRQDYNAKAPAEGKLTMTAILVKVIALALRRFPQFNSSLDPGKQQLILKKYVHVGVAVDTPRGLLVPVIRDADRRGLDALAADLNETAQKTREGKIAPADLEGGTFTISNLGGIGGVAFSPIVYTPQVAILGVSRSSVRPVWDGDDFAPRLVMPLSLSYDHRVIDGADGARFLRFVCEALEQPLTLLLGGDR